MAASEKQDAMQGLALCEGRVRPEWIDYNDHMNVAYYVLAFDLAIDDLWARLGITEDYIKTTRGSTFAVESHVVYSRELRRDDAYLVTMELVAYDAKRIHQFQRMYHKADGYLAATAEWMSLHVNLDTRRVAPWADSVLAELAELAREQEPLPATDLDARLCGRMRVPEPTYSRLND